MRHMRDTLAEGTILPLGGVEYRIDGTLGMGGSAICYRAHYGDAMQPSLRHHVLVKELFPWDAGGGIVRGADGLIHCLTAEAREIFKIHRRSFLTGNRAHLALLEGTAHGISGNINSVEANGTCYTVLPFAFGDTLQQAMEAGRYGTLREKAMLMLGILDALAAFHQNNMLHLDISPDNILLSPYASATDALQERILIIDYSSVFNMEDGRQAIHFSYKDHYCAPEVRLRDISAIGPCTDLYSLSCVFCELLTGTPSPPDRAALESTYRSFSPTVVHQLEAISKKGLAISPKRRYQSIEEMRAALLELVARIDGRGLTHSALWDISRAQYRLADIVPPRLNLPVLLEGRGELIARGDILPALTRANLLVTGEGGLGKTTLLHTLWAESLARYSPSAQVLLYLPMRQYKGERDFLQSAIIDRVRFDGAVGSARDARHALRRLLDAPLPDGRPAYILLLDGLNEIAQPPGPLLEEIDRIAALRGVRLLATARAASLADIGLAGFTELRLKPPDAQAVRDALTAHGLPYPEDGALRPLLHNPMMLTLYVQAMDARVEGNADSREDILRLYLQSLLQAQKEAYIGDAQRQMLCAYALEHLLPRIAMAMEKASGSMSVEEMARLVGRAHKTLRSRAFAAAFPAYIGKSRLILAGTHDAWEWYDIIVVDLLQHTFRLLVRNTDGSFSLSHAFFEAYLAPKGRDMARRLYRAKARRALPGAAALVVTAALVAVAFAVWWPRGAVSFPAPEDEKALDSTLGYLGISMDGLGLLLYEEEKLLDMADRILAGTASETDDLGRQADAALLAAANLGRDPLADTKGNPYSLYAGLLPRAPEAYTVIPLLTGACAAHAGWATEHMPRLVALITQKGDGAPTNEQKAGVIASCRAYLNAYACYAMTGVTRLGNALDDARRADLHDLLRGREKSPLFRSLYSSIPVTGTDEQFVATMDAYLDRCGEMDQCLSSNGHKCLIPGRTIEQRR